MKSISIYLILFLISQIQVSEIFCQTSADVPLSEEMLLFIENCDVLLHAISDKDKYLIADASEAFEELGVIELEESDFSLSVSSPNAIGLPDIQFCSEYCDLLRSTDFVIVEREPLSLLRANMPDAVSIVSRSISPQTSAIFTFQGQGEMEMVVPSDNPEILSVELIYDNSSITLSTEDQTIFPFSSWRFNDEQLHSFSVKLTNNSDKKISFAIALR